ncbi:MAG TPA: MFS transporter [Galbitalea sp.]|nr:MFS transporter [Galbitalea sp.]
MTAATPATRSPFAEPTRRVGGAWIALFATAWLGIWMAQLTPIQLLLPQQVEDVVHGHSWTDNVLAFGIISGIAGACALITFPLTGALSDRTTSRFGRRRPWIFAGVVVFAVSLVILSIQTTIVGVGVFWSISIIGFCIASAATTATLSDQVPVNQRGFVSGWISAPQAIGTILGLTLVTTIWASVASEQAFGYPLVAILLIVLAFPFIGTLPDQPIRKDQRPSGGFGTILQGFWINPVKHPDFGWTLLGRILVNLGNALGTTLLLYFLQYGLGLSSGAAISGLLELTVVYLVFFVIAALVLGRVSDRIGRRKVFVYIAAWVQAAAALILAFVPVFSVAIVAAGLLGLGYGCYMAVDQALATQVLPDAHSRGKDLGIMNIATAVPQAVGPLLGALVVLLFAGLATMGAVSTEAITKAGEQAGFAGLFVASGVLAILGGVAMIPIKSVK